MTDPDPQSRRGLVGAAAVPAGRPSAARVAPEDDLAVVRARTQREIDDEIASLGEVPFFSFSASDDTAASEEADAGPAAESAPTDLREAAVPAGADEPGDGDPFGWLFRADVRPTAPAPVTGHRPTASVSGPTDRPVAHSMDSGEPTEPFRPSFAASPTEDTGPMPAALFAPAAPVRPAAPFASAPVTPAGPRAVPGARPAKGAPPRSRGRRGAAAALAVSLCLVVAAAGAVFGVGGLGQLPWAHLGQSSAVSSPTPSSPAAVPGQVWDGEVAAIDGVGVTAGCVAEPALDAAGNTVTYGPTNLLDDDPNTAWRCDEQTAPSITFTIPEGHQVAEVGLINGYAKVDPQDGSDRYPEYRRVMLVRWTLPNGSSVEQLLEDETATMQRIRIPVTEGPLTLTVLRVTNPGTTTAGREAVVISDVVFAAPR